MVNLLLEADHQIDPIWSEAELGLKLWAVIPQQPADQKPFGEALQLRVVLEHWSARRQQFDPCDRKIR